MIKKINLDSLFTLVVGRVDFWSGGGGARTVSSFILCCTFLGSWISPCIRGGTFGLGFANSFNRKVEKPRFLGCSLQRNKLPDFIVTTSSTSVGPCRSLSAFSAVFALLRASWSWMAVAQSTFHFLLLEGRMRSPWSQVWGFSGLRGSSWEWGAPWTCHRTC